MARPEPSPNRNALIGREAELGFAVDHVDEHGQFLLTGEPGVGKSTLLEAVAQRLTERGFAVTRVAGNRSLADQPFGALGHVVGDPEGRTGAALAQRASEQLRGLSHRSGAVIVVDDAHDLDPWSLQAIVQARLDRGPRIVAAARSSDVNDVLAALGRHPGAKLEVQRLSLDETARLAAFVLGAALDTPSAARVHHATDGLPLAVVELVRYATRRGVLVERSGLYRWSGPDLVDRHLAGLLGLRLDDLDAEDRDVVDALAVVGELPAATLEVLVPGADLEGMERQRLVRATPRPGRLMIGHPLLRDAAEAMLAPYRRRQLSARIADVLFDQGDPELERLAVLLAVGIDAPVSTEALVATVRWGRERGMWRQFLTVMERAWRVVPNPMTGLAYGEALYWTRDMTGSEHVLAEAEALCRTDHERIAVATARARTLDIGLGRGADGDAIRLSQLRTAEDPADVFEVRCAQAERWLFDGEVARIVDVFEWAVATDPATAADPPFEAARYRFTQTSVAALGLSGQVEAMADEYAMHLALARSHAAAHPLGREVVDPWWAACNLVAGRPDRVRSLVQEQYEAAMAIDDGLRRPLWALPRAIERWLAGDLVAAEHFAREAMGVPDAVVSIRRMATHYLSRILVSAGRHDEALAHARATAGDDYVGIVRAWSVGLEHQCLASCGAGLLPSAARASMDVVRSAVDGSMRLGQRVAAAYIAHDVIEWDDDGALAVTLDGLAMSTDAPSVEWMAVHARTRRDGQVMPLVRAASDAVDAGCHGIALQLAESAACIAVRRRDVGAASAADELAARSRASTTGFPARERDLTAGVGGRFGLSAREIEVMRAAAAGLTDQEIAAELVISVRTVNAHLRAIYRKVGVNSRRDLRSL